MRMKKSDTVLIIAGENSERITRVLESRGYKTAAITADETDIVSAASTEQADGIFISHMYRHVAERVSYRLGHLPVCVYGNSVGHSGNWRRTMRHGSPFYATGENLLASPSVVDNILTDYRRETSRATKGMVRGAAQ